MFHVIAKVNAPYSECQGVKEDIAMCLEDCPGVVGVVIEEVCNPTVPEAVRRAIAPNCHRGNFMYIWGCLTAKERKTLESLLGGHGYYAAEPVVRKVYAALGDEFPDPCGLLTGPARQLATSFDQLEDVLNDEKPAHVSHQSWASLMAYGVSRGMVADPYGGRLPPAVANFLWTSGYHSIASIASAYRRGELDKYADRLRNWGMWYIRRFVDKHAPQKEV